jgi:hypothetical protein
MGMSSKRAITNISSFIIIFGWTRIHLFNSNNKDFMREYSHQSMHCTHNQFRKPSFFCFETHLYNHSFQNLQTTQTEIRQIHGHLCTNLVNLLQICRINYVSVVLCKYLDSQVFSRFILSPHHLVLNLFS